MLRKIFRPAYGEGPIRVEPKHWWNPRQRKAARVAARITDYYADEIRAETQRRVRDAAIYGFPIDR